ncbi:hypothetical protein [Bradyrhizobium sp. LHD-71]|uniref:hypothetical protein n=1 Tax=Bradyrhizobium sp. LHD-71 TaxID=3072141 RepID=UPI00280D858D|nr:hypothetical protein [Bradyrhizobium sp. LHD-71]MDQ8729325.1 hypothetical protein [Bradyrhizobium sp. LHD-71]
MGERRDLRVFVAQWHYTGPEEKDRRMRSIAIALIALLWAGAALAQGATYDIAVKVDATKASKSPWDGVPGLGASRANINAAPDIAICLVRAEGRPQCLWRPQGRRLLSQCQNATSCTFEQVSLRPVPIGLLFIDIDARRHDLIDIVILSGNATAEGEADVERALRAALAKLVPNLSESAKERGLDKARVLPLDQCSTSACRLTQSEFRLTRRD